MRGSPGPVHPAAVLKSMAWSRASQGALILPEILSHFRHFISYGTSSSLSLGFLACQGKDSVYLLSETRGLAVSPASADTAGGCGASRRRLPRSHPQWGHWGHRASRRLPGSAPAGRSPWAVRPRSRKPCVSHGVPPNHQVCGLLSSTARQREGPGDRSALPPLALVLHVSPPQPPKPVLGLTPSLSHGLRPGPPRVPTGQQEGAAQEPAPKAAPTQGLRAWPRGAARAPGAQVFLPTPHPEPCRDSPWPPALPTRGPHTQELPERGPHSVPPSGGRPKSTHPLRSTLLPGRSGLAPHLGPDATTGAE